MAQDCQDPQRVNFVVRIPADIHATLARIAAAEDRSLNWVAIEAFRSFAEKHMARLRKKENE